MLRISAFSSLADMSSWSLKKCVPSASVWYAGLPQLPVNALQSSAEAYVCLCLLLSQLSFLHYSRLLEPSDLLTAGSFLCRKITIPADGTSSSKYATLLKDVWIIPYNGPCVPCLAVLLSSSVCCLYPDFIYEFDKPLKI